MKYSGLYSIFVVAVMAGTLSACSTEQLGGEEAVAQEISFSSTLTDVTTRVTNTDAANIRDFCVNANYWDPSRDRYNSRSLMSKLNVVYNSLFGHIWDYSPVKYYPLNNATVYFAAFSPAGSRNVDAFDTSATSTASTAVLDYRLPKERKMQEDLLVATASVTPGDRTNRVTLDFKHALAKVQIQARSGSPVRSYTITKIVFKELLCSAKCDLVNNLTWSATYSFFDDYPIDNLSISIPRGITEDYTDVFTPNELFLLIPQTVEARNFIEIEYSYLKADGSTATDTHIASLSTSNEFKAGHLYTIQLTLLDDNIEINRIGTNINDFITINDNPISL